MLSLKYVFGLSLLVLLPCSYSAYAQEETETTSKDALPPVLNWVTQCTSPSRLSPLECVMEQRVIIRETGQQLAKVTMKTSSDQSKSVSMMIQLPLGLSISEGISVIVDAKELLKLTLQACDGAGCFATTGVSAEVLGVLKSGKELIVQFQDLRQRRISVNFTLAGFSANFRNVE